MIWLDRAFQGLGRLTWKRQTGPCRPCCWFGLHRHIFTLGHHRLRLCGCGNTGRIGEHTHSGDDVGYVVCRHLGGLAQGTVKCPNGFEIVLHVAETRVFGVDLPRYTCPLRPFSPG